MKAVGHLRRHEKRASGEIHDIAPRSDGSEQPPMFPVPQTPSRDLAKEELPWYWRSDDAELQPRTPPYGMIHSSPRRASAGST